MVKEEKSAADVVDHLSKVQADVHDKKGNFTRRYSAEQHGPKFKDLAAEYAGKIGGSVR